MIEYILTQASTSLFQAICFIVGALVFAIGLLTACVATVAANERYKELGAMLVASGSLIAMPAVIPIFLGFNFENSGLPEFPLLVLNFIYFAAPTCGVIQLVLTLRQLRVIKKKSLKETRISN